MGGRIYISGAFKEIDRGRADDVWLDNDPHFWDSPPTWGICRTDYRRTIAIGDYVFFVLSKRSRLPQMIYGFLQVKKKITHEEAYHLPDLRPKRMGNKNPNGNIIVDSSGQYNRFDRGVHRRRFEEIRQHYIVGVPESSMFLTEEQIRKLSPSFVYKLNEVFGTDRYSPFEVLGRSGRRLSQEQVNKLLNWLGVTAR